MLFYSVGTTVARKPKVLAFNCGLLLTDAPATGLVLLVWPLPGPKGMSLFVGLLRTIQSKEYIEWKILYDY